MSDQVTVDQPVADEQVSIDRLEALLVDLNKSMTAVDPSVEIISKGADAIVEQNRQLVDAVEKSITAMSEKIDALVEKVNALDALTDRVEKGFTELAAQPVPSKAITSEAELAPADTAPAVAPVSKADVLSKALNAMQNTTDPSRLAQLRKGVAQLESNFNPAQVAADLSL
jgi:peptidoglycan hydrolase CwlO-like protein